MEVKKGIRAGVEVQREYDHRLAEGLVATDGVVYTPVATFGTTAAEILSQLIDPGFTMRIRNLYAGLTQQFTGLNGSFVASMNYYWQMRSENYDLLTGSLQTGSWINVTGTYLKNVGTLLSSEDTFSGYIPVGSVPYAPVRARLMAVGIQAAVATGRVKNSSRIILFGDVIPGT